MKSVTRHAQPLGQLTAVRLASYYAGAVCLVTDCILPLPFSLDCNHNGNLLIPLRTLRTAGPNAQLEYVWRPKPTYGKGSGQVWDGRTVIFLHGNGHLAGRGGKPQTMLDLEELWDLIRYGAALVRVQEQLALEAGM